MREISFSEMKKNIHLKKCVLSVRRKDKDYFKSWNRDKLTFYKDYKSKMIWFGCYGIGFENKYYKIDENNFLIETEKTEVRIELL